MPTILVVDDEPGIRNLYRLELEEDGYEVLVASDCAAALEVIDSIRVDLVVLDIKLQKQSGLRVLQEIDRGALHIPVILSTALPSYRRDVSTRTADAYIVKSSNLKELKSEIAKSLSRRRGMPKPALEVPVPPVFAPAQAGGEDAPPLVASRPAAPVPP